MSTTKSQTYPSISLPKASIKRILCASSLTPESDQALDYALLLARSYSAKLFCFYSIEKFDETNDAAYIDVETNFTKSLAAYLSPSDVPIPDWEVIVSQGDPANKIVSTAIEQEIDLIVMLSRRRPLAAALLGSTTEIVCKVAPCPILVIHPNEKSWVNDETGKVELSRILVGCDFSKYSKQAFSYALEFAKTYGSSIDLLHTLPKNISTGSPVFGNPVHQSMNHMEQLIPETDKELKITRFVAEGEPYQELLDHIEERNVDLVCIGAHGRDSKKEYLFGTTTDKILRAAKCPVLVTRYY
ncbi:MAG: universal stress protein [Blastocatellia bacterium]|nr:universal stress protein [Blastocatellia bacterium]MBN8725494.1 universal stress protein [Acidobacteriota bacterium]